MRTLRRAALALLSIALVVTAIGVRVGAQTPVENVIVMGIDGLDYALVRQLIDAGRMPNFARLEREGQFGPLATAASPQSPVAWSNFITGLDSGGHGIYDFLHRDLEGGLPFGLPYTSTALPAETGPELKLGRWLIPLWGGGIELARHGEPFWQRLADQGIGTTLVRMPANFPPVGVGDRELSGMGTPDLRGTPGEFFFFTTDRRQFMKTDVNGGYIYPADVIDGRFVGTLVGIDDNPLTSDEDDAVTADFTVYVDPVEDAAKIEIGTDEFILEVGEWSDWVTTDFDLIPYLQSMSGAVRFHLKSVRPEFELYVTPLQIDPAAQAMPISEPASFAEELAEATGRFYTQEMPEDTKAVQHGVFGLRDFLAQTAIAREETIAQFRYLRDTWEGGFLFSYFGSVDQTSHVMWGITQDPTHPAYDAAIHDEFRDVIPTIYAEFDALVGETLDRIDDNTVLVVMSDHGFASWTRAFHLNSWLVENGYMTLQRRVTRPVKEFFTGVDWRRSQAYSVGISALYLNLRGREPQGQVAPGDRMALLEQLERELLATIDPLTGEPAVTRVFIRERDFHDRGNLEIGPDIVVGYAKGVRGSGNNALGGIAAEFMTDNTDDWSGDHIMDPSTVPGVLLASRPLRRSATSLQNLAAALLAEFGIEGFPDGSEPVTVVDAE
jgi:predicted AlkP superfamily phosphohydrolase/phosphomutase